MDNYVAAQFAKLDPNAEMYRVKVISGNSETGEFPNETHWMNATPTQIGAIRVLLGDAFQPGDYYFPAFWYAMGKLPDDTSSSVQATAFANWFVARVASGGDKRIATAYDEWHED